MRQSRPVGRTRFVLVSMAMIVTPSVVARRRRAQRRQEAFLRRLAVDSQFHHVFDGLPGVHFFVKNRAGELLFLSRGILAHNHLTHELDAVGKTDFDLNPGPYAERYVTDDDEVYRTGKPLLNRVELWFDRVGLPDWFVTNKYPLRDRRGRIIGLMGTLESCADRRRGTEPFVEILPAVDAIRRETPCRRTVPELAALCRLSVRGLERRFHAAFAMSPQTFLMKMRIRTACEWLQRENTSLSDMAMRLDFSDQSAFTRHFRTHVGRTPRRYRLETRAVET
jgi:AraC-like DNA-binding protein